MGTGGRWGTLGAAQTRQGFAPWTRQGFASRPARASRPEPRQGFASKPARASRPDPPGLHALDRARASRPDPPGLRALDRARASRLGLRQGFASWTAPGLRVQTRQGSKQRLHQAALNSQWSPHPLRGLDAPLLIGLAPSLPPPLAAVGCAPFSPAWGLWGQSKRAGVSFACQEALFPWSFTSWMSRFRSSLCSFLPWP